MADPLMSVEIEQDQGIDFTSSSNKEQDVADIEQAGAITTGR
jgi:hypothetical protein